MWWNNSNLGLKNITNKGFAVPNPSPSKDLSLADLEIATRGKWPQPYAREGFGSGYTSKAYSHVRYVKALRYKLVISAFKCVKYIS
jgi:hypothetical protein